MPEKILTPSSDQFEFETPLRHAPTLFQRPDQIEQPLYVIMVVFNPIRYRTRWKLAEDAIKRVNRSGAILYLAEVAFGHRNFVLTDPNNPQHLQLSTTHELWLKENIQNLLLQRLPINWRYVAFMDADVALVRDDWANATLHELQHYRVVQMWSEAHDLDSHHRMIQKHKSFAFCHVHHVKQPPNKPEYPYGHGDKGVVYWHPGYCWAYRRESLNAVGGLVDFCVLGSADYHMANGLIGKMESTLGQPVHERFKYQLMRWQEFAEESIKHDIGYVPGALLHYWHGSKTSRRYQDRWKILTETHFNPDLDLKRDWQGLWQLTDRSLELRDRLQAYSRQRNEDEISSEEEWETSMDGNPDWQTEDE